ncbi:MAG: hypothetical protein ACLQGV_08750 [Bryobacteraceae bacterium]
MSSREEQHREEQPPYLADDSLLINSRLGEIERQQTEEKKSQREYNKQQLRFNKLLVLFTALLFLTSVVSNFLTFRYVGLTKRSAEAATSAADTAAKTLGQSKAALDATIEASRRDQRAWLTVRAVSMEAPLRIGEKPRATVEVANSGKTPAVDATIAGTVLSRRRLADALSGATTGHAPSRAVIGPDATLKVTLEASEAVTHKEQIDAVASGPWLLYATGRIVYRDIFHDEHVTEFCFQGGGKTITPVGAYWASCARGNSIK